MTVGDVNAPCAVPVSFKSPGQVALNDPFADVAVCSLTVHLKSVQVLGVGMIDDDVQVPSNELLPATVGAVSELCRSTLVQPAPVTAAIANTIERSRLVMAVSRVLIGRSSADNRRWGRELYHRVVE